MNLKSFLTGAFALAPLLSSGQAVLSFSDQKTYRQVGDRQFIYEGGDLAMNLRDGSVTIVNCVDNGSRVRVLPYIFCPLGTTGFITAGDIDDDGIRDVNTYWSVGGLVAAQNVEPFQTQRIRMIAAPPSTLGRPLGGASWEDSSVVVWFDQINRPIRAYEITQFDSSRPYLANQLQDQLNDIVPGTYIFEFPRLNDDQNPYLIRITHLNMIEAWPGRGVVPGANEFTMLHDGQWRNGALEVDPRIFFKFQWRGFNGNTTLPSDSTNFSIISRFAEDVETVDDFGLPITVTLPAGTVVFPPYDPIVPQGERFTELIPTPSSFYELGPFFFSIGDQVTGRVDFSRNQFSTGNSRDTSTRSFQWDINFVDTYDGYSSTVFPATASESLFLGTADFDGDGSSNIEEFALQTDPVDPASVPVLFPVLDELTNQCIFTVPKRPLVGGRLKYQVEYTTDLNTWTTITASDPNWLISLDNATSYEVISRQAVPDTTCLLRVRVTQL
ncbi:MAG: hypothetical protein ACSHYF_12625 [Verrucomicrobiaceae bacterium]